MFKNNTTSYHLPADAVWFITGCSSGIGAALALHIASKPNQRLVATARNPSSLSYLPSGDGRILKLALDVSSPSSITEAVNSALSHFHRLDVVVNNAGYGLVGDTESIPDAMAREQLETNFWGTAEVTRQALRVMREENPKTGAGGGVIFNVTSVGGFTGIPGSAYYHASKFAVEGFTESVAKELRPEWNVHLCIVEPGAVRTNFAGPSLKTSPARHPAYAAPDMPTRMIEALLGNAAMQESWSRPEPVAAAFYELASRGRRIPMRVPLGADSWGIVRQEAEDVVRELDELKELSCGMGQNMEETMKFLSGGA